MARIRESRWVLGVRLRASGEGGSRIWAVWGSAEGLGTASDQRPNLGGEDFQLLIQRRLGFLGNKSKFPRDLQLSAEFGE